MKKHGCLVWVICLVMVFFLSACAGHKKTLPPQTSPAETIPQIGTRQAAVFIQVPRLDIIITLTKKAEQEIRSKRLEAAFATLEQAVGIDAQDPFLWHLMARVQLMQGHPDQAEQLAKKSNLLAVDTPSLEKKNGDIIARSRSLQGMSQEGVAE